MAYVNPPKSENISIVSSAKSVHDVPQELKLRYFLTKKEITVKTLADMTGISPRTIERFSTGRTPIISGKFETVMQIANALDIDPKDFL